MGILGLAIAGISAYFAWSQLNGVQKVDILDEPKTKVEVGGHMKSDQIAGIQLPNKAEIKT
jgi:hypothetical protein